MDSSQIWGDTEECHSSESGWTMYIDSPVHHDGVVDHVDNDGDVDDEQSDGGNYVHVADDDDDDDDVDDDDDGYAYDAKHCSDSDDSMASDASSGPTHTLGNGMAQNYGNGMVHDYGNGFGNGAANGYGNDMAHGYGNGKANGCCYDSFEKATGKAGERRKGKNGVLGTVGPNGAVASSVQSGGAKVGAKSCRGRRK